MFRIVKVLDFGTKKHLVEEWNMETRERVVVDTAYLANELLRTTHESLSIISPIIRCLDRMSLEQGLWSGRVGDDFLPLDSNE